MATESRSQFRKIILLGMVDSVHVARWLEYAVAEPNLDIFVIPTSPHRRIHGQILDLENSKQRNNSRIRIHALLRYISLFVWVLDRPFLFGGRVRAIFIKRSIQSNNPDLVHIMETQNGGYPYLRCARNLSSKVRSTYRLALTLFGSDLFWFTRFDRDRHLLQRLLPDIDILAAECVRDIKMAMELGFAGDVAPLSPVSGGLSPSRISKPDNDQDFNARDVIAIKGYGGNWGLGHLAIKAVAQNYQFLQDLKVVIFSAESKAKRAAKKYLRPLEIDYSIFPKFALSHKEMLALYKKSLIYIGLSKSDGLPASMLEAMSQGAFPVQTSSACTDGWFDPDETGTLVDVNNIEEINVSLADLLRNRAQIRNAQEANLETIESKYSTSTMSSQITYGALLKL
jgi:glycosyltransferase involved in cell wall biosynthesis